MADVPLALYVIGTVSPVVAGGLPLVVGWIRETGRDKRQSAERLAAEQLRLAQEKRGECVKLLRLARDYRVLVADAEDSHGADLISYAKQIRQAAADITGQADDVGFMVPAIEDTASLLAAAARMLAAVIADRDNRVRGEALRLPDFTGFDGCLNAFKAAAQIALGDRSAAAEGGAVPVAGADRSRHQLTDSENAGTPGSRPV
jgi:hypothetical protein